MDAQRLVEVRPLFKSQNAQAPLDRQKNTLCFELLSSLEPATREPARD